MDIETCSRMAPGTRFYAWKLLPGAILEQVSIIGYRLNNSLIIEIIKIILNDQFSIFETCSRMAPGSRFYAWKLFPGAILEQVSIIGYRLINSLVVSMRTVCVHPCVH